MKRLTKDEFGMRNKICCRCEVDKDFNSFYRKNTARDGFSSECKDCHKEAKRNAYLNNPNKFRQRSVFNREKNPEYGQEYSRKYREEHKEYFVKSNKKWCENNKERLRSYKRKYQKDRLSWDIEYKLKTRLRGRLSRAMRTGQKRGSAVEDLGCSVEFLKSYLENKFTSEMSWKNYGEVWEIDPKKPLAAFNLADMVEFRVACNWRNLQPLLVHDNRSKGSKYA